MMQIPPSTPLPIGTMITRSQVFETLEADRLRHEQQSEFDSARWMQDAIRDLRSVKGDSLELMEYNARKTAADYQWASDIPTSDWPAISCAVIAAASPVWGQALLAAMPLVPAVALGAVLLPGIPLALAAMDRFKRTKIEKAVGSRNLLGVYGSRLRASAVPVSAAEVRLRAAESREAALKSARVSLQKMNGAANAAANDRAREALSSLSRSSDLLPAVELTSALTLDVDDEARVACRRAALSRLVSETPPATASDLAAFALGVHQASGNRASLANGLVSITRQTSDPTAVALLECEATPMPVRLAILASGDKGADFLTLADPRDAVRLKGAGAAIGCGDQTQDSSGVMNLTLLTSCTHGGHILPTRSC